MAAPSNTSLLIRRLIVSAVLVVGFVYGGTALFAMLAAMREPPRARDQETARTLVRTQVLRRRAWDEELTGYGHAVAFKRATVSAQIPGVVVLIEDGVRPGGRVDHDAVLVRLDGKDQQEALNSAQAQLAREESRLLQARAALTTAERRVKKALEEADAATGELKRLRELAQSSSSSRSEVDAQVVTVARAARLVIELEQAVTAARHQISQAESAVTAARALRNQAQQDQARATIKAPWAGVVAARHVEQGQRVAAGTALFDLVIPDRVEVAIRLGASHYGEVGVGAEVSLRLREDGPVAWSGAVSRVAPEVDDADRTFLVYCDVLAKQTKAPIPPGAFVVATVRGRSWSGVVPVPRIAFVGDEVYVVERTPGATAFNVVKRTPEVFKLLPEVALVRGGVKEGDEVVMTNLDLITGDSKVRVAAPLAMSGNGGQH